MTASPIQVDPDVGLPDLVRQLAADSKRLVRDEVTLAKLETAESIHAASRGALWLGVAFGVGIVALVALTVALATGIGQIAGGNMWVGALATGVIELGAGALLVRSGIAKYGEPSYTLEETREEARETVEWLGRARAPSLPDRSAGIIP